MHLAIIEDTPDVSTMLRVSLTLTHDVDVTVADSYKEAILLPWGDINATIIDRRLGPSGSGEDVIDWLQEQGYTPAIVLLTSDSREVIPDRYLHLYMQKPAGLEAIGDRLGLARA